MKKRQETGTESYNKITAKYTPATTNPRKCPPAHDLDDDSTDAGSPDKRLKVATVDKMVVSWNSPFYQTLLGLVSSVTKSAITNKTETSFLPLPALHRKLVKACFFHGPGLRPRSTKHPLEV